MSKSPYSIIQHRHVTEKARTLELLKENQSNRCIAKYALPKYVFLVDLQANKTEIARAVEAIYPGVEVKSVNTIRLKPKRRRVRGRSGYTKQVKKAIVTLGPDDTLGEQEEV